MTAHRLDDEKARCVCGGEWMWFEPENVEGCEVAAEYDPTYLDGLQPPVPTCPPGWFDRLDMRVQGWR